MVNGQWSMFRSPLLSAEWSIYSPLSVNGQWSMVNTPKLLASCGMVDSFTIHHSPFTIHH
jgi:hypothetical protein